MDYIELISVPTIIAVVYAIIEALKKATNSNATLLKFTPLIALALGGICGIIAYYAVPAYIEASNLATAIIIGIASGLSATGTNQILQKLTTETSTDSATETSTSTSEAATSTAETSTSTSEESASTAETSTLQGIGSEFISDIIDVAKDKLEDAIGTEYMETLEDIIETVTNKEE
ncbi:MAG: hypothetical protein R3Y23_05990 [Bacillota bacterium]